MVTEGNGRGVMFSKGRKKIVSLEFPRVCCNEAKLLINQEIHALYNYIISDNFMGFSINMKRNYSTEYW